jgi:hypothetical protein
MSSLWCLEDSYLVLHGESVTLDIPSRPEPSTPTCHLADTSQDGGWKEPPHAILDRLTGMQDYSPLSV